MGSITPDFFNVYSISSSNLWVAFWLFMLFLFVIVVCAGAWFFFANNVKVLTFSKVGERGQRSKDFSGRKIVRDGSEFLKVGGVKDLLPWPASDFVTNHKGFRYKTLLNFYKTSEAAEDWKPIKVDLVSDGVKFEAHDAEVRLWSSTRQREKVSKYDERSWLDKYGAYVGLGMVAIILVFTVLMTMDALKETTASIGNAQTAVSGDLRQLTQMQERIGVALRDTKLTETEEVPAGG